MSEIVYDQTKDTGQVDVALGVVKAVDSPTGRRVELHFERPITRVHFDAENARQFAEQLARAAYEANYGAPPQAMGSRLTEELRLKLVSRVALVAGSLGREGKNNMEIAQAVVDVILKEVA